jgi:hypothetical protein
MWHTMVSTTKCPNFSFYPLYQSTTMSYAYFSTDTGGLKNESDSIFVHHELKFSSLIFSKVYLEDLQKSVRVSHPLI